MIPNELIRVQLRSVAWKNKRGYTLLFLLVDPNGKVSMRRKIRLRKARTPKKRILRVAKAMASKLRARPTELQNLIVANSAATRPAPAPKIAKKSQALG